MKKIVKYSKERTKNWYKKKLDTVFSLYIRNKYVDDRGLVTCYTCHKFGTVKELQNGHFVPRQYLATRWDDRNCRPQCYACNMLYNGQPSAFALRLERETPGIVEELERLRKTTRQWTIEELKKEIDKYQKL